MLESLFNINKENVDFPITEKYERRLPNNYNGYIYIWDIDGTYLNTNIKSLKTLIKSPFELPNDKKNIEGAEVLLRQLRIGYDSDENKLNPLYFITASPPFMEKSITRKMIYDRVEYDGIIYKDFAGIISNMSFKEFKSQLTYKLYAFVHSRSLFPKDAKEILFGDNLEQDAEIYSLYEKIIDKYADYDFIERNLKSLGISENYLYGILNKAKKLEKPENNPVKAIYIHLTNKQKKENYRKYTDKLIPVDNYFQASASLYEKKHIRIDSVKKVFDGILSYDNHSKSSLINTLKSMEEKEYIKSDTVKDIIDYINES
ncbi:MAG: phosphatase domain-containing protein [Spirochaetota bacterium]